jgi:Trk K+ transport system NAD-binding subunit
METERALVIGAGGFGRQVILSLLDGGCAVDVVEKELGPRHALRNAACRWFQGNAWNLDTILGLDVPSYACCYLCLNDNLSTNLRVIRLLKSAGARQIAVRVSGAADAAACTGAGATLTICPEELAGRALVRQTLSGDSASAGAV